MKCYGWLLLLALLVVGCTHPAAPLADYAPRTQTAVDKASKFIHDMKDGQDTSPLAESQKEMQAVLDDYRTTPAAQRPSYKTLERATRLLGPVQQALQRPADASDQQMEAAATLVINLADIGTQLQKESATP